MSVWKLRSNAGVGERSLLDAVLESRGLTVSDLCCEVPCNLPQAVQAAERVAKAVLSGEKIGVFGDYDCDGICGAVVLSTFLGVRGTEVLVRLPNRDEGYGIKPEHVKEFYDEGVSLIVTVDSGITAVEAVRAARELGIDVVVTDHHEPRKELPPTPYLVNPKLWNETEDYSGAGVAYLFCCEVAAKLGVLPPEDLLDLAGLAAVVDVTRLTGKNFALTREGLMRIRRRPRAGVKALAEVARANIERIGGHALAWQLGPRINAAGRMGDPVKAYRLLTAFDYDRAYDLAVELDALNRERQELVEEAVEECLSRYCGQDFPIFVTDYPHGIVGVVAGRLAEELCRPVLVGSAEGDLVRASGRAAGSFDLLSALEECQERTGLFTSLGGHKKAAGVSFPVSAVGEIAAVLEEIARERLTLEDRVKFIDVDAVLDRTPEPKEVAELDRLEPFGEGNPEPVFYVSGPVGVVKETENWVLVEVKGVRFFVEPGAVKDGRLEAVVNLRLDETWGVVGRVVEARPFSLTRDYLAKCYKAWRKGARIPEVALEVFRELGILEKVSEKVDLLGSTIYRRYGLAV